WHVAAPAPARARPFCPPPAPGRASPAPSWQREDHRPPAGVSLWSENAQAVPSYLTLLSRCAHGTPDEAHPHLPDSLAGAPTRPSRGMHRAPGLQRPTRHGTSLVPTRRQVPLGAGIFSTEATPVRMGQSDNASTILRYPEVCAILSTMAVSAC